MKPPILQARIKLQFWGELFKLNNNFQNNAKFNVGPSLPYATPNMSQRILEIFTSYLDVLLRIKLEWLNHFVCSLQLISHPDIFHKCKMKLWSQLDPFQCAWDTILTERQVMKNIWHSVRQTKTCVPEQKETWRTLKEKMNKRLQRLDYAMPILFHKMFWKETRKTPTSLCIFFKIFIQMRKIV